MALVKCDECDGKISSKSIACVHCGSPAGEYIKNKGERLDSQPEQILAKHTYSMVKAAPFWFLICLALCLSYGVGLILLAGWSLIMSPRPTLTITDRSLIYKDSHFKTSVIPLQNIRSIAVGSGILQNLLNAGYLIIKTSDSLLPILVNGLSDPKLIKTLILEQKV